MSFKAKFVGQNGNACKYRIQELNNERKRVRAFTVTIPSSQRASANGWEGHLVERRCVSTAPRQMLTEFSESFVFDGHSRCFPENFAARKLQEPRSPARLTHSMPVFSGRPVRPAGPSLEPHFRKPAC